MFKKENQVWLYLAGILIMFAILTLTTRDFMVPFFFLGSRDLELDPVVENEPTMIIDTSLNYYANVNTNFGTFTIDLYEKNAPINVNNFIYLSNQSYYNGTKFHRLIPNFLLQGGDRRSMDADLTNDGSGNAGYVIDDEINIESLNLSDSKKRELRRYDNVDTYPTFDLTKYKVAMATSGRNTNGSQFFIVLAETNDERLLEMNGKFTVIGQITDGFATLTSINTIPVLNANTKSPQPQQDVVLNSVEVFTR